MRHNTIYERARFNQRAQNDSEPIDSFVTDLHTLSENCQCGSLKDELIRDRIVVGIRDKVLSEKMQMKRNLTLVIATDIARHSALIKSQAQQIAGQSTCGDIAVKGRHQMSVVWWSTTWARQMSSKERYVLSLQKQGSFRQCFGAELRTSTRSEVTKHVLRGQMTSSLALSRSWARESGL